MGFEIHNCISRTHECQKIKGACSSFFQKYINCPNITRCLPLKIFSPEFGGGGNCPLPLPPTPMVTAEKDSSFIAMQWHGEGVGHHRPIIPSNRNG